MIGFAKATSILEEYRTLFSDVVDVLRKNNAILPGEFLLDVWVSPGNKMFAKIAFTDNDVEKDRELEIPEAWWRDRDEQC